MTIKVLSTLKTGRNMVINGPNITEIDDTHSIHCPEISINYKKY